MKDKELNAKIIERGRQFFASIKGETPSIFDKEHWIGKVMDRIMKSEDFKVQMFRFIDVFPCLTADKSLTNHIREYFAADSQDVPAILKWGAKSTSFGGKLGAAVLNRAIRMNIRNMAKQFIVGEKAGEALKNMEELRRQGFALVVDILGEATVSEYEAEEYVDTYLKLLDAMKDVCGKWTPLKGNGGSPELDWGHAPKVNVAVKPTTLYSQTNPRDFEGSVVGIMDRMKRIMDKVIELEGFLCIDMESYKFKDITLELYRRMRLEYCDYPHFGIVLQSYLRDTDRDLEGLLAWSQKNHLPISVRLVKGAYWDYETVIAKLNYWKVPVWTLKAETDAAFERHVRKILEHHEHCHLACGSHNIRSIASVMEHAQALGVPDDRYEFQVLYGMAEPVRKGLLNVAKRLRLYCPYGEMVPGMAYLVRRLLENTANESFLRQSFAEDTEAEKLLEDPEETVRQELAKSSESAAHPAPDSEAVPLFRNEPAADFTKASERNAFPSAIAQVRRLLGKTYCLFIDGWEMATNDRIQSVNPANPLEAIGNVCLAGTEEVEAAIAAAKRAFPAWRDTEPRERAEYLFKAANAARRRLHELSAWQVLEVGKQWDEAHADVTEAIDFLEYYGREMIRLGTPKRMGSLAGEVNLHFYEPRGIAAVIAPWNFPLAIACGMTSAAIVTGNCVVFKPASFSCGTGHHLVEIFEEVGLPAGVFNFTPGRGSVIGDFLVEHPHISVIAFTGSMEVGLGIVEKAAEVHPGQTNVKKVICEMGGKNAIIIDDDADLDEAVPRVLYSAFGFQGQKCSACSRVIVLDASYERFVERLVRAADSMKVGPAEDPANAMGPVVDVTAQKSILEYIEIGKREGTLLYSSTVPETGYCVPITIIGDIEPRHRLAQEEVFGPVLAVMRAKNFDQALDWANSTPFALTGGVFSRSPKHLERAWREFRVGNLYLNRGVTGALVGRQPFGGSRMSGVGTKSGGHDYLLHFMDPYVVTENTMRRGFAPIRKDDEWVD